MKKLIYILNQYSKNSTQHFYHVVHLLTVMADLGAEIVLVIEKCDEAPVVRHANINVIVQRRKNLILRVIELRNILKKLRALGFRKVFVRISAPACLLAKTVKGLEVYFWQSGTVNEYNKSLPLGIKRLKNYIATELPFQLVLRFVDCFVTGPESMRDYYIREFNVPGDKIKILYNDIDISRFNVLDEPERMLLRKSLGIPQNDKVILFVHRFSPVRKTRYYLPYVLERFLEADTGQTTIILIGEGSEKRELHAEIKALELDNILMLGGMPNQEIQKYYSIADIFINPTHAEGFPRVLIEAMACGLPIVTTDAGGISDILPPKQMPFMVDKNNRAQFSDALIKLSQDTVLLNELRRINRNWVQRYSTEKIAAMYLDVLFDD